MKREKQLSSVNRDALLHKKQRGLAMNIKEFALSSGVSYSKAREWFHKADFPQYDGFVFWEDFVLWRHKRFGLRNPAAPTAAVPPADTNQPNQTPLKPHRRWSGRAARILAEFS